MFLKTLKIRVSQPAPRAITLVEMLISMAVTLVMMAAVVNLFANIGAGVRNRRASMELGSQLRMARARLFKDLAGATSAARPKLPSDDHDDGYLEIIEGVYSDKNPSALIDGNTANGELDYTTSLVPSGSDPQIIIDGNTADAFQRPTPTENEVTNGGALGDYDDILALTVRSESEPFQGRLPVWQDPDGPGPEPFQWVVTIIESDLAEVIWYSVENPADGSLGEPGMRTVYRRVLLIAPWVDELPPQEIPSSPSYSALDRAKALALDRIYYQLSDISFRQVIEINDPNDASDDAISRVPNTLSDLTKRENRFSHDRFRFPYLMETRAIRNDPNTTRNNFPEYFRPINGSSQRPFFHPFGLPFEWDETESGDFDEVDEIPTTPPGENFNNGNPTVGSDRKGEDVMLNDVLAFDLRVYDPGAPLVSISGGPVLEPSDAGWNPSNVNAVAVGFGAFVDLGWDPTFYVPAIAPFPLYNYNYASPPLNIPVPLFKEPHTPGWHSKNPRKPDAPNQHNFTYGYPATYDTWPYHYENDGIDQEAVDFDPDQPLYFPNLAADNNNGIDQGTNGLDDIVPYDHDNDPFTQPILPAAGVNGVDDPDERETQPPYNYPLRAMQAKIRVYDRESRQIREATVTRNFVPQ